MSSATVTFTGRAARDAEPINSSTPMAKVTIPSTAYVNKEDVTMWWKITLWGRDAEFALRNVKKGDIIHVSGEPYERVYEKDGKEMKQNCVDARVFRKVASGKNSGGGDNAQRSGSQGWGNGGGGGQRQQSRSGWGNDSDDGDSIPF